MSNKSPLYDLVDKALSNNTTSTQNHQATQSTPIPVCDMTDDHTHCLLHQREQNQIIESKTLSHAKQISVEIIDPLDDDEFPKPYITNYTILKSQVIDLSLGLSIKQNIVAWYSGLNANKETNSQLSFRLFMNGTDVDMEKTLESLSVATAVTSGVYQLCLRKKANLLWINHVYCNASSTRQNESDLTVIKTTFVTTPISSFKICKLLFINNYGISTLNTLDGEKWNYEYQHKKVLVSQYLTKDTESTTTTTAATSTQELIMATKNIGIKRTYEAATTTSTDQPIAQSTRISPTPTNGNFKKAPRLKYILIDSMEDGTYPEEDSFDDHVGLFDKIYGVNLVDNLTVYENIVNGLLGEAKKNTPEITFRVIHPCRKMDINVHKQVKDASLELNEIYFICLRLPTNWMFLIHKLKNGSTYKGCIQTPITSIPSRKTILEMFNCSDEESSGDPQITTLNDKPWKSEYQYNRIMVSQFVECRQESKISTRSSDTRIIMSNGPIVTTLSKYKKFIHDGDDDDDEELSEHKDEIDFSKVTKETMELLDDTDDESEKDQDEEIEPTPKRQKKSARTGPYTQRCVEKRRKWLRNKYVELSEIDPNYYKTHMFSQIGIPKYLHQSFTEFIREGYEFKNKFVKMYSNYQEKIDKFLSDDSVQPSAEFYTPNKTFPQRRKSAVKQNNTSDDENQAMEIDDSEDSNKSMRMKIFVIDTIANDQYPSLSSLKNALYSFKLEVDEKEPIQETLTSYWNDLTIKNNSNISNIISKLSFRLFYGNGKEVDLTQPPSKKILNTTSYFYICLGGTSQKLIWSIVTPPNQISNSKCYFRFIQAPFASKDQICQAFNIPDNGKKDQFEFETLSKERWIPGSRQTKNVLVVKSSNGLEMKVSSQTESPLKSNIKKKSKQWKINVYFIDKVRDGQYPSKEALKNRRFFKNVVLHDSKLIYDSIANYFITYEKLYPKCRLFNQNGTEDIELQQFPDEQLVQKNQQLYICLHERSKLNWFIYGENHECFYLTKTVITTPMDIFKFKNIISIKDQVEFETLDGEEWNPETHQYNRILVINNVIKTTRSPVHQTQNDQKMDTSPKKPTPETETVVIDSINKEKIQQCITKINEKAITDPELIKKQRENDERRRAIEVLKKAKEQAESKLQEKLRLEDEEAARLEKEWAELLDL